MAPAPTPTLLRLVTLPTFLLTIFALTLITLTLRLLTILPPRPPPRPRPIGTPNRLFVVLGSGGHTAEMLSALRGLDTVKYTHRTYVVSSGDRFSASKAVEFERTLEGKVARNEENGKPQGEGGIQRAGSYDIAIVPRARRVHQSLLSTPWSAGQSLWACLRVLRGWRSTSTDVDVGRVHDFPDLIVMNGPATAVVVVLAAFILRFFDFRGANSRDKMRTVYMESWARVTTLSLSGKLLLWVLKVDRFLVQWEHLEGIGGRAEFLGVLV